MFCKNKFFTQNDIDRVRAGDGEGESPLSRGRNGKETAVDSTHKSTLGYQKVVQSVHNSCNPLQFTICFSANGTIWSTEYGFSYCNRILLEHHTCICQNIYGYLCL